MGMCGLVVQRRKRGLMCAQKQTLLCSAAVHGGCCHALLTHVRWQLVAKVNTILQWHFSTVTLIFQPHVNRVGFCG